MISEGQQNGGDAQRGDSPAGIAAFRISLQCAPLSSSPHEGGARRGPRRGATSQIVPRLPVPPSHWVERTESVRVRLHRLAGCALTSPSPRDAGAGRGRREGSTSWLRWPSRELAWVWWRVPMIRQLTHNLDTARPAMECVPDFQQHAFAIVPPFCDQ